MACAYRPSPTPVLSSPGGARETFDVRGTGRRISSRGRGRGKSSSATRSILFASSDRLMWNASGSRADGGGRQRTLLAISRRRQARMRSRLIAPSPLVGEAAWRRITEGLGGDVDEIRREPAPRRQLVDEPKFSGLRRWDRCGRALGRDVQDRNGCGQGRGRSRRRRLRLTHLPVCRAFDTDRGRHRAFPQISRGGQRCPDIQERDRLRRHRLLDGIDDAVIFPCPTSTARSSGRPSTRPRKSAASSPQRKAGHSPRSSSITKTATHIRKTSASGRARITTATSR